MQKKLQNELDDALQGKDDLASSYEVVKNLPYLNAVIKEGLRIHSTSGIGLPRVVPKGGIKIQDHSFEQGTVLSVPSYTIHRDVEVWGEDSSVFRPERWLDREDDAMRRTFNPFSCGPRFVPCDKLPWAGYLSLFAGLVLDKTLPSWSSWLSYRLYFVDLILFWNTLISR